MAFCMAAAETYRPRDHTNPTATETQRQGGASAWFVEAKPSNLLGELVLKSTYG